MSLADQAVAELESTEQFFNRSTRSLTEEHSGVKPAPDVMTAAQQVAHAAQTIDWFIEGAFRREGFDTNFQAHAKAIENCTSLTDARAWFAKAVAVAKATLSSKSNSELTAPIADGPIMGGAPRMAIISAVTPHALRRTFATEMFRAGCDPATLQSLLGHNDIRTTMHYIRPVTDTGQHIRSPLDLPRRD